MHAGPTCNVVRAILILHIDTSVVQCKHLRVFQPEERCLIPGDQSPGRRHLPTNHTRISEPDLPGLLRRPITRQDQAIHLQTLERERQGHHSVGRDA